MFSIQLFYTLTISALISSTLVPITAKLAVSVGGVDQPENRKIHCVATPRIGGVAIFCALLFTIIYFCDMDQRIKGCLAGAIVIFLTGLIDDLTNLTPHQKFAGQFLAAGMVIFMGGLCYQQLGNPFGLGVIELGPLAVPFTLLSIVGLINAINLLDGLDGLAAGVCAISCVAFAIIAYTSGNTTLLSLSLALLGSLVGFLRYNHHPAIIFMGDCGSLLLGYCMGVFSVMLATGGSIQISPFIPLLLLGVPVMDTLVVMANRKLAGKSLFHPDKTHIHHRLLDLGLGHRVTVLIVYGLTYLYSIIAIFCNRLNDSALLAILLSGTALVYGFLFYLKSNGWQGRLVSLDESSLRFSERLRALVQHSALLTLAIKFMLLTAMLMPAIISYNNIRSLALLPVLILVISLSLFLARFTWYNLVLQSSIFISGTIMVFVLENLGRDYLLFGLPLHWISHVIFIVLLLLLVIKARIRKRFSQLLVSPFEYLILLIALSMPLLPSVATGQLHLLTVTAKSVILFMGFKLVLMRKSRSNNKIFLNILLSKFPVRETI